MDQRNRILSKNVAATGAIIDPSKITQEDLNVERLPGAEYTNPLFTARDDLVAVGNVGHRHVNYVMYDPRPQDNVTSTFPMSVSKFILELAQSRTKLHFNPATTVVGIVTCGGLCPGLNDVIRALTLTSINTFHVKRVIGFKYGFWGLSAAGRHTAEELTIPTVGKIHRHGGTLLGSSRGPQDPSEMVDTLVNFGVNILFTVGGDGTQKGAASVSKEAKRRGLDIAVFGIPKTIDNDLTFSHRTFGFETAVEQAVIAIRAAHAEACSHQHGIGIVKLMGRESGFIAAQATVSSSLPSICLIPERPVTKEVVFKLVESRFMVSSHCVIVVAEGFGQNWAQGTGAVDLSGNKRLIDIGELLKDELNKWLKEHKKEYPQATIKYIDPSYMIRACPPNASDSALCGNLSTLAVHEAMAGATNCIVANRYSSFILVPIPAAVSIRRVVDLKGMLWRQVREITVSIEEDHVALKTQEYQRELHQLNVQRERIIAELSKL
jgi:6-phosphofructokinase 1